MKKSILTAAVLGVLVMSSCSNNGTEIEAHDAQEVIVNNNELTISFDNVQLGSTVDWRASHLGGAEPRFGKIQLESAKFLVENNQLVNAKVVMDMNSFTVENFPEGDEKNEKLRGHLQAVDFFDVAKYPTAIFELTNLNNTQGDYSSVITGNLTIMKITKSITFNANVSISKNEVSIKSEDFAINRADWNLTYHAEGSEGVPVNYLIANDIGFTIDVTLEKS